MVSVNPMVNPPTLRTRVAVGAVRTVNWLSRVTRQGAGTVAGGRVGLVMDGKLLNHLAAGRSVIVVSGTNGKTTTTALIAAGWGSPVATNATGANMVAGHVAALVTSTAGHVVLEADESWLPDVVARVSPRAAVLLNLSRDQLDRAGEVRQIAERWRRLFADASTSGVVVVANANDPLVVYAAEVAAQVRWCDVPTVWREDAASCPKCTRPIEFDAAGWRSDCGFSRPSVVTTTLDGRLRVDGVEANLALEVPGDFNAANAAMGVTALAEVGISVPEAIARMNGVVEVAGRFAQRRWRDRTLRLVLAKNPAGFAAVLAMVEPRTSELWIAINDNVADGRDPSWLYDAPFEVLRGLTVACLGTRRVDLAARLDYAGVNATVIDDLSSIAAGEVPVWLIANYTAFSEWLARSAPC